MVHNTSVRGYRCCAILSKWGRQGGEVATGGLNDGVGDGVGDGAGYTDLESK